MARRVITASHVIAYQDGGHRHLRDGVVVTEDDAIVQVGRTQLAALPGKRRVLIV